MRSIGLIAGVIVIVGVLAIGSQGFLSGATTGVSADAPSDALIPSEVTITKEQYQDFVATFAEYFEGGSLAEKNEIITEMRERFYDLVPH